jgi:hypothetical protein
MTLNFRLASPVDSESLWIIIEPIIREGSTYVFYPDSSPEKMLGYWMDADKETQSAGSGIPCSKCRLYGFSECGRQRNRQSHGRMVLSF